MLLFEGHSCYLSAWEVHVIGKWEIGNNLLEEKPLNRSFGVRPFLPRLSTACRRMLLSGIRIVQLECCQSMHIDPWFLGLARPGQWKILVLLQVLEEKLR